MARTNLILDRYEPIGTAGSGGFGTVQIAWDPRIQRKVAIKTIQLTELDAYRAGLPGAQAVAQSGMWDSVGDDAVEGDAAGFPAGQDAYGDGRLADSSTSDRWHGVQPWSEYLEEERQPRSLLGFDYGFDRGADHEFEGSSALGDRAAGELNGEFDDGYDPDGDFALEQEPETFHAMAHLPGLDEARTAAMLDDPRIVTVYDFEVRGRTAYLIMEYVEGLTLTKILHEYADWLTLDVVAAVFDAVAGALTAAHDAGVLHLDIKPDNILINLKGEVKVTDFGLATLADASGAGTTGGGTIGYMPLEQMRREHLDARTDEWSLASVTYEMLTGENPFLAKDLEDAAAAIEDAELVLPSLCWESIDEQIDDVVFYALDPDREERYASVRDFAEEADKFLGDAAAGKEQLVAIVEDGLGLTEEEPEDEEAYEQESFERAGLGAGAGAVAGAFGLVKSLFSGSGAPRDRSEVDDERAVRNVRNAAPLSSLEPEYDEGDWYDGDEGGAALSRRERREARRVERGPHTPLRERTSANMRLFLSRAYAAIASGLIGMFGAVNITALEAFGSGQYYVAAAFALAAAGLAIVRPHLGALVSFALVSIALVMNNAVLPAVILLVALAAWWYFVARESEASSNVGLLAPLAGAIGGASAVPLLAGAALKPLQAAATTAFAGVCALVLATLGSKTMLGWDALSYWTMNGGSSLSRLGALVTEPSTWVIFISWIAAALVQSLLASRGKKWLEIVGLVLAVAIVVVAAVVFYAPTVQLVISLIAGALVVLIVIL